MSNSATISIALKIDDKGGVRVLQNIGKESSSTGAKGKRAFNDMDQSAKSFAGSAKMSNSALAKMGSLVASAFATAKVTQFTREVLQAGVALDSLNRSYEAIMGTAELANREILFVNDIAKQLGLNLPVLEKSYQGILAASKDTALEGAKVRKVFDAVSQASAVLGLSADDTSGALRALSQMISKGNVQAEELRGQLGERLPGAFQMASEAMGVSTMELNKMLEQGQVLAVDLLPRLADVLIDRYGEAAKKAGDSSRAAFENLNTAVLELKRTIANSGLTDFFADMARGATTLINIMNKGMLTQRELLDKQIRDLEQQIKETVTLYEREAKSREDILQESLSKMKKREEEYMEELALKRRFMAKIPFDNPEVTTEADRFKAKITELNAKLSELKEIRALESIFDDFIGLIEKGADVVTTNGKIKESLTDIEQAIQNSKIDSALDAWFAHEKEYYEEVKKLSDWLTKIKVENIEIVESERANSWQEEIDFMNKMMAKEKKAYEELKENETKATQKALEEQTRAHEQFVENVQDETADVFYDLFSSPATFWKNALDEMTDYFYRLLAQWAAKAVAEPIIVPIIQQVGGGIASALGFGGSSGGFNLSNLSNISSLKNVYSLFGNNVPAGSFAAAAGIPGTMAAQGNLLAANGIGSAGTVGGGGWGAGAGWGGMAAGGMVAAGVMVAKMAWDLNKKMDADRPAIGFSYADQFDRYGYYGREMSQLDPTGLFRSYSSETGNDAEIRNGVEAYFASVFEGLDKATNSSIADVLANLPKQAGFFVDLTGSLEDGLAALSDQVYDSIKDAVLLDLFPGSGSTTKTLPAYYNKAPDYGRDYTPGVSYGNDAVAPSGVYESWLANPDLPEQEQKISALADKFNDAFFNAILPDGSRLDALIAFGNLVKNNEGFMEDFTRQMEQFGATAIDAFNNLAQIDSILAVVDSGIKSITTVGADSAIKTIADEWVSLIAVLEEAHATTEQLAQAEMGRNIALGTQLTGLTATSIQAAIANNQDITSVMQKTITTAMAGVVAESVVEKYILPLNEQVGKAYLDSAGDIQAAYDILSTIDFSAAQDEINIFVKAFGGIVSVLEKTQTLANGMISYNSALDGGYMPSGDLLANALTGSSAGLETWSAAIDLINVSIKSDNDNLYDFVQALAGVSTAYTELNTLFYNGSVTASEYNSLLGETLSLYGQSVSNIQSAKDAYQGFIESIGNYLGTLTDSSEIINLSYERAKRNYQNTLSAANSGDAEARGDLISVAGTFLNASQKYNSSQYGYQRDIGIVRRSLDAVQEATADEANTIDLLLDEAKIQTFAMNDLGSVMYDNSGTLIAIRSGLEEYHSESAVMAKTGIDLLIAGAISEIAFLKGLETLSDFSAKEPDLLREISETEREEQSLLFDKYLGDQSPFAQSLYAISDYEIEKAAQRSGEELAFLETLSAAETTRQQSLFEAFLGSGSALVGAVGNIKMSAPTPAPAPIVGSAATYDLIKSKATFTPSGYFDPNILTQAKNIDSDGYWNFGTQFNDILSGMGSLNPSFPDFILSDDQVRAWESTNLPKWLGLPGYEEGGISSGPMSGYPVLHHGIEATIPLKNGFIPVEIKDSGTAREIRALKEDLATANIEIIRTNKLILKILKRVNQDKDTLRITVIPEAEKTAS